MTIYLTGFMGCGKSSTGRRVARALGYTFADTDCLVEETAGKSIARIFAEEGETVFRQLETEALVAIPQEGNTVVATGGGLPCSERNLSLMRQRAASSISPPLRNVWCIFCSPAAATGAPG